MNLDRIINMFIRIIMRKAINSGIKVGMNAASGRARKSRPNNAGEGTPQHVSGQAKQVSRVTRRLTRL